MADKKQKNRRYRDAKISEYQLRNIVDYFAKNLTVKETSTKTTVSEKTVRDIFMRLRNHLYTYGFMRVNKREGNGQMPARFIFAKKHRGVPEKYAHLFESEVLHRIYFTKNGKAVRRFSANKADDMQALQKFINYNKINKKYDIIEILNPKERGAQTPTKTRPFDPHDYEPNSVIVINELNIQPSDIFFRYIWAMLLKHPL